MITGIDLDHVAVAVERMDDAWPRYAGDLAGEWMAGGATVGFASAQVRYANGMRLEVLRPHRPEKNDFLRRFLDRHGPGVHHLTFKVPDLEAALAEVERAGVQVVGVDFSDPHWKEAFIHPKEALGIVVQLAWSTPGGNWRSPKPEHFPSPRTPQPATLERVVHTVASLDDGRALFSGLLGGRPIGDGEENGRRWVELAWPGPGRLRLVDAGSDLDGRPGRFDHLAFSCAEPGGVADAEPISHGVYEVRAAANLGVRLRLREALGLDG